MAALEIKLIETEMGFLFKIIKQDYRDNNFYINGNSFKARDGFKLISFEGPGTFLPRGELMVRGINDSKDDNVMFLPDNEKNRIYIKRMKKAIKEYNEAVVSRDPIPEICKVEIVKWGEE